MTAVDDFFLSWNPAEPWSFYPIGLPAFALVALGLVALTLWTYLGHPQARRGRLLIVLALRLAALAVVLLTAVRKVLDRCESTLEELRTEQNVNVVLYAFGRPDFTHATGQYDPAMPAK